MNEYSVFQEKVKSKDWHYDPKVKSTDYIYLGNISNIECSDLLSSLDWGETLYCSSANHGDDDSGMNSTSLQGKDPIRLGYTKFNTSFYKIYPDTAPEYFHKISKLTGLQMSNFNLLKQPQGQFQPWHFDTYMERIKTNNLNDEERYKFTRYLIMLEDWDWGHFLQIGNNVFSQWSKGDIITWKFGMYHLSANAGLKPKYTMLVTGKHNENSLSIKPNFKLKV